VIRRAILLRSILHRRAQRLFDGKGLRIDPGVLRAFLETTSYRHGARSLEAIVAMSLLSGHATYERSCLPAGPQLALHVDADDFLAKVQCMDLEGALLEQLARAAHQVYYDDLTKRGFHFGPVSDDKAKTSDALLPYDELEEFQKEQNRRNVRDIPAKLQRLGCVMVPARAGLPPFALTQCETDTLAREEHERWMRDLGPGWRYGIPTDKPHKISEAYLPWQDLPEKQKDKDRNLVRQIPTILHEAGYAVVRTRPPAVAIAVTGHRILDEIDKLQAGLEQVVHRLEDAYPGPWTIVSALAEGADRLVAHRLLARKGTRLVAVLPLEREDYETDFATDESRREFADLVDQAVDVVKAPAQASRDEAYEAGGRTVLDRADVLVAVWDGQGAQGLGGTGGIVAQARQRGLPLVWVHAGNRRPGTLEPTSLGDQQGEVTYERIPETQAGAVP
jgi:hypothetical protein